MKTNWHKTQNKDYLGSWDLDDGEGKYKDVKLIIAKVELKKVKDPMGEESTCRVATFAEKKVKPFILNAGNSEKLQKFTKSRYIEDWRNVPVQIGVQEGVKAFGDVVDALRIRDVQPKTEKTPLNPDSPKWPEAVKTYSEKGDKCLKAIMKYYDLSDENLELLKAEADAT